MASPRYLGRRKGYGWADHKHVSSGYGVTHLNCTCIPGKNKHVLQEKKGIKFLEGRAFDFKKCPEERILGSSRGQNPHRLFPTCDPWT